jgi:hypothetical protein
VEKRALARGNSCVLAKKLHQESAERINAKVNLLQMIGIAMARQ